MNNNNNNNIPQLNPLPFPIGSYSFSLYNEFYIYAEKTLELLKNEKFVFFMVDCFDSFSIHYLGGMDTYLNDLKDFREIYNKIYHTCNVS